MSHLLPRRQRRMRRKIGIRKSVAGTPDRPRLAIFRSLSHIYAQVIDDISGRTLVSASSLQAKLEKGGDVKAAEKVGELIAQKTLEAGIKQVAFDRGGFRFHGRVKALAEGARKAGLAF